MSCGKWAPLKLIIRALPLSSSPSCSGRAYLNPCISKNRDRTLMPPGAPQHMKKTRPYSMPRQRVTMPAKGLVVRSCSDWCPEPATELDLDTCRHHELLPASSGKSSTQGSLSCSGYPASPQRAWRCQMDVVFTRC